MPNRPTLTAYMLLKSICLLNLLWLGSVAMALSAPASAAGMPAKYMHLADSIGMEQVNGQWYVLHQVEAKETWYALARRYKADYKATRAANPGVADALNIGQVVRVPYSQKVNIEASTQPATPAVTTPKPENTPANAGTSLMHTVQAGETLYALGRKYGVSAAQIKEWNGLTDNTLSLGQQLQIRTTQQQQGAGSASTNEPGTNNPSTNNAGTSANAPATTNNTPAQTTPAQQQPDTALQNGQNANQQFEPYDPKPKVVPPATPGQNTADAQVDLGFEQVKENGFAEVIEGSEDNKRHLALHATAPIGTIMSVRNEMNNQMTFVRVLGRLPNTSANQGLLIKISRSAYETLGAVNKRFRVEISYLPAEK